MILRLLAAVFAITATPARAATNLIVNGSFETPVLADASFREVNFVSLFPWVIPNASMLLASNGLIANTPIVVTAQSGRQFLDLRNFNPTGRPVQIFQDVTVSANSRYELAFHLGNIEATGPFASFFAGPAQLRLNLERLSGPTIFDQGFSNSSSIVNRIDWARRAVRFNGFNGTLRVSFYADLANNDEFGGLDNVSLVAVAPFPEPGTWALLIAGLGLTGAAMRSQRSNSSPAKRERARPAAASLQGG